MEPVILLLLNGRRKVINTERINLWLRQTEHIRVYLWHGYPTTVNLVMVTIVKQSQWWLHLSHLPIKYVKKRYICFCYIRLLPCVLKFNKINWLYYFSCLNIYMQCTTSANSFSNGLYRRYTFLWLNKLIVLHPGFTRMGYIYSSFWKKTKCG